MRLRNEKLAGMKLAVGGKVITVDAEGYVDELSADTIKELQQVGFVSTSTEAQKANEPKVEEPKVEAPKVGELPKRGRPRKDDLNR